MFRDYLVAQVADPSRMPPRLAGRYLAPYIGREGLNHLQTLARAIEDDELDDLVLQDIHHPTVVVRGNRDRQCDQRTAEGFARDLPAGRYAEMGNVGRLIPEEAPAALVDVVMADPAPGSPRDVTKSSAAV